MSDLTSDTEEAKEMQSRRDGNVPRYALGLTIVLLAVPLAGCLGDGGVGLAPASVGEEREETTIPFEGQGSFDLGAGVCTRSGEVAVNACSASNILLEATPAGTVQTADLELVWDAENPLMEELGITLAWACNDDGCETEWASGTSPVGLTVDEIDEQGKLFVLVWTPRPGAQGIHLDYKTSQEVEVTGSFTSLVAT